MSPIFKPEDFKDLTTNSEAVSIRANAILWTIARSWPLSYCENKNQTLAHFSDKKEVESTHTFRVAFLEEIK